MRGREQFKKYKVFLGLLEKFYRLFPLKMRKKLFEKKRRRRGKVGLAVRYALLKTLAKSVGENVSVHEDVFIRNPQNLSLGDNVSIHPMCYIEALGGLEIGNDVSIAHGTTIMTTDHNYKGTDVPIKDQGIIEKSVKIEDNVWIGAKATILGGNTVETGSIVAAGAVVTKNVPAYSIAGGGACEDYRSAGGMNIAFFHDHRFRFDGTTYYSTGGLDERTLLKYIGKDDVLTVYARVVPFDNSNLSPITDPRIQIFPQKSESLAEVIKKSDACIIRLPSFVGIKAARLARKYKKKYLIEAVGSAWDAFTNHGLAGKIIAPYMELVMKREVKSAPYVTYVTTEFLQREYPTNGKNIGVSDVVLPESDDDALKKRLDRIESSKGLVLGTIGSYEVRYKSQETVIKAMGILKKAGRNDIEYRLVGAGNSAYLKGIAEQEGVADQVKFLGTVKHEKINNFFDEIDIYIQPSLLEGLCRSIVEAFNRACPAIASNVGGNPELVGKEYLFSHKGNPEKQLAGILSKMDTNRLKAAAKENFDKSKLYQRDYLYKKWKDFYDEFVR